MRATTLPLLLLAVVIFGCATPANQSSGAAATPVPSYITASRGCAVVVGGSVGSSFADLKVAGIWHEVNKQISDYLYDDLAANKYKVAKLTIAVAERSSVERLVMAAMARNQCNRVIQISHTVNEDARGRFFQFNVAMMHVRPKGERQVGATGTNVVTVGDFQREYRYPRTAAAFESFRTGTFAALVFADLKQSGALEALR